MFTLWAKEESNRGLQVIAILMAITLWIFVGLLPRIDSDKRKVSVEIKLKNAPEDHTFRTEPAVADVLIEGPKAAINKLSNQDLEVFVDMKHRWGGKRTQAPLNVSGPPGIRWELTPSEVEILEP